MKKITTFAILAIATITLFVSCSKRDYYDDDSYWLSQEQGKVVYSSDYCSYYIVQLSDTYVIVRSYDNQSRWPYPNDRVYGNFNSTGNRDIYNYTDNYVMSGRIVEFVKYYDDALDAIEFDYCQGLNMYGKVRERKIAISK